MGVFGQAAQFIASHPHLLVTEALGQIELVVASMVVALVIALPVGLAVGHLHRWSFLAISGGNVLRALPTLAIIAVGISIYGIGFVNILVALVILALPLILTNSYVGVAEVDPGVVEAARGMGMTGWQILWRVELPNAVPLIMAGIRTASVYVIATAYLATFAGSTDTLGSIIGNESSYGLQGVIAATAVVIVIALIGEVLFGLSQRALTPKGLKLEPVTAVA
ncbi:MAG TPA: ABC transporter permease [Acidimicrobiales bacterium]|nr:ABC transporter permease [Acidimicrobiales bacterium]